MSCISRVLTMFLHFAFRICCLWGCHIGLTYKYRVIPVQSIIKRPRNAPKWATFFVVLWEAMPFILLTFPVCWACRYSLLHVFIPSMTVHHHFSKIFIDRNINMQFLPHLLSVYIALLFHLLTIYTTYENFTSRVIPVFRNELKRHDHSTFVGRMFSIYLTRWGRISLHQHREWSFGTFKTLFSVFCTIFASTRIMSCISRALTMC